MSKKKNSALDMLAQVMAQMAIQQNAPTAAIKPDWGGVDPTDPSAVPTVFEAPTGGK